MKRLSPEQFNRVMGSLSDSANETIEYLEAGVTRELELKVPRLNEEGGGCCEYLGVEDIRKLGTDFLEIAKVFEKALEEGEVA